MRTFEYRTWGGTTRTVEADAVVFQPSHVVFLRGQEFFEVPFIVLAESNSNVHNLREVAVE